VQKRIAALSLVALFAVSACGGTASPVGESSYKPGEGKAGGTLVFGDWQEALTFNPAYIGQVTEFNVVMATQAGLTGMTPDLKYVPDMASVVPTVENELAVEPGLDGDAMTVTWKLRDGLKWSDGVAITCADFVYSHNWVLSRDENGNKIPSVDAEGKPVVDDKGEPVYVTQPLSTLGYDEIDSIECASDTEMVFHYGEIYEGYLGGISVYPKHYFSQFSIEDMIQGAGFTTSDLPNVPVSGPFKFASATPGAELRLARNENYTSALTGKAALLDEIVFKWYASAETMIAGFRAGEIDIATDLNDADIASVADLGFYEDGGAVSAIASTTYEFLRPNHSATSCSKNPAVADRGTGCPAADPAVRKAIAQAVNKAEINERLLGNNAQIAATNISPVAYYFDATAKAPVFDIEAAKATLEAAGWVAGADGVREKDGLKLKIELCTTTRQVRQDTLALVAATLKEAGFATVISPVDASTQIFAFYTEATPETPCNLAHGNFDVAMHAFSSSVDPLGNYATYHSSQFEPTGGNDAQVSNAELDAALETVKSTIDFAEVAKAMKTFQQIYVGQTIEIPLFYRKAVELVAVNVGNFVAHPTLSGPLWNAVDLYIK
jgi:peptide/nickel transport system substrate-binding protein